MELSWNYLEPSAIHHGPSWGPQSVFLGHSSWAVLDPFGNYEEKEKEDGGLAGRTEEGNGAGGGRRWRTASRGTAQRPPAHFGEPLTRIVPQKELHLWHHWTTSHGAPPPISAHPSRESCPGKNSAYGTFGQLRMTSPRPFRRMPHTDRAPHGAPPTASVGALARGTRFIRHPFHADRAPQGVYAGRSV